jgi:hypothetical protein
MLIPQKLEETDEEKEFQKLAKTYKGDAFSTEGICTLGRFWKTYIVCYCVIQVLGFLEGIALSSLENLDIIEIITNGKILTLTIYFWSIIIYFFITLYIGFLKIKRFRSVDLNPWLVLVPFFSRIVVSFLPCKKNFQNNKYFKGKIKYKPLLVSIMVIIQFAFALFLLAAPFL